MTTKNIALVGNPNVGKSVIFAILTGKYVQVSNYPGTTVEVTRGDGKVDRNKVTFIDTPGTNSLLPMSEDECVTRDILLNEPISAVLQIGDGKNLKRVLFLSLQLSEMGIPYVLNLNMMDELESTGIDIDIKKLSDLLGIDVNSTVAIRRRGTEKLDQYLQQPRKGNSGVKYSPPIENAINEISKLLHNTPISKRALAIMLLVQDQSMKGWVAKNIDKQQINKLREIVWNLEKEISTPIGYAISQTRQRFVEKIFNSVVSKKLPRSESLLKKLDLFLTHPIWSLPFIAISIYLIYLFVGRFGAGLAVDFFEGVIFGKIINPGFIWLFSKYIPIPFLQDLFIGDYGIVTMALSYSFAIVLPIVATFFVVFSILEDSGYLPRLALMVNRFFKIFGLNGKAVLPMVLGLGCDTMATMTTRILETRKERIIVTLLLALGIPCSAQLGVILGMTGMLPWVGRIIWIGVVSTVMIIVGYLAAKLITGVKSDFIIELPPLRIPEISNILVKTVARIEWYIKEIVPIFILGTLILFIFHKINILEWVENLVAPLVQDFLGLPVQTTEAFLIGFLRRDYGAAGLFALANQNLLNNNQIIVSIITITLFVPCIANFLVIIKEFSLKIAVMMSLFIVPFAFIIGGLVNLALNFFEINL